MVRTHWTRGRGLGLLHAKRMVVARTQRNHRRAAASLYECPACHKALPSRQPEAPPLSQANQQDGVPHPHVGPCTPVGTGFTTSTGETPALPVDVVNPVPTFLNVHAIA